MAAERAVEAPLSAPARLIVGIPVRSTSTAFETAGTGQV